MAYSFTEKKRVRKDFGKQDAVMEIPFLLATQIDSYRQFLQLETTERLAAFARRGLHAVLSRLMVRRGIRCV